jgi:hypothetical protein
MTIPFDMYPLFAPLPGPFIEHLVHSMLQRNETFSLPEAIDRALLELREKRWVSYQFMNPFVRMYLKGGIKGSIESFSTAWFLNNLSINSPGKKKVPQANLTWWQKQGLLRYREHGIPEPDSAAAFYINRLILIEKRKGFLPSQMTDSEPDWWCWKQCHPQSVPEPCPVPLPPDLEKGTLLWTQWAGASWNKSWLLCGRDSGAIRFAGVTRSPMDGNVRWHVSAEDLAGWEPKVVSLLDDLPEEKSIERQEWIHSLATHVLQRLAEVRLPSTYLHEQVRHQKKLLLTSTEIP